MAERWGWVVRYVVVIILAVVLALALGEMELFKSTRFGKSGLNAARLVQFLGFGGAMWCSGSWRGEPRRSFRPTTSAGIS